MTTSYMKKRSPFLIIKETANQNHTESLIPTEDGSYEKDNKYWQGCGETRSLVRCW